MKIKSFAMCAALCFCFSLLPGHGSCSEARVYQITETELTELEEHLNELARSNSELLNLLESSSLDLNEAQKALAESRNELSTLKGQLEALKTETRSLNESLLKANKELASASESFKRYESETRRTKARIETQRNIWAVLACILGGAAAAR